MLTYAMTILLGHLTVCICTATPLACIIIGVSYSLHLHSYSPIHDGYALAWPDSCRLAIDWHWLGGTALFTMDPHTEGPSCRILLACIVSGFAALFLHKLAGLYWHWWCSLPQWDIASLHRHTIHSGHFCSLAFLVVQALFLLQVLGYCLILAEPAA